MRSKVIGGFSVLVATMMLVACGGPPQLSWETLGKYDFNVVEADPGLAVPSRHLYELMYFSRLASAGGPVSDAEIQFFRDSLTVDTLISLSNETFDLAAHWYQYRDYRDRVNTWLRQEFWQQEVSSKVVVDSQEVVNYYREHVEDFARPEQVDVYHILSTWLGFRQGADSLLYKRFTKDDLITFSEEYVRRLYQMLLYGESFQNVAFNYSHDVLSRGSSGHLGWTTRQTYKDPFDSVVFSLKDGDFSEPYLDSDGWHIIYRERYLSGDPFPLDSPQVYVQAQQAVFDRIAGAAAGKIMDSLRAADTIEINPAILGDSIIYSIPDSVWGAVVNGVDTIDVLRLKGLEEGFRRAYQVNSTTPDMRRQMVEQAAGPVLVTRAAKQLGLDTLAGFKEKEREIWNRVTKALRLSMLYSADDYQPPDSAIAQYYDAHLKEFTPEDSIRAEQLIVQDEELAYFLRGQFEEGLDLKYLADNYGKQEGYDIKYEDLGVVEPGKVDSALFAALQRTHPSRLANTVKTSRGYHLAKVIDRNYQMPLSMARSDIKARLIEQYRRNKWEAFRDQIFREHNVRFPGVLPAFELPRLSQRNHPRTLPPPAYVEGY